MCLCFVLRVACGPSEIMPLVSLVLVARPPAKDNDDTDVPRNRPCKGGGRGGTDTPPDAAIEGDTPRPAPAFGVGLCWVGFSVCLRAVRVGFLFLAPPLWGRAARPSGCEACLL